MSYRCDLVSIRVRIRLHVQNKALNEFGHIPTLSCKCGIFCTIMMLPWIGLYSNVLKEQGPQLGQVVIDIIAITPNRTEGMEVALITVGSRSKWMLLLSKVIMIGICVSHTFENFVFLLDAMTISLLILLISFIFSSYVSYNKTSKIMY